MTATLVEFEEEFATYPEGGARIPGIGPALPPGELLLWVGSPDARRIARQVLHVRFLVGYFTVGNYRAVREGAEKLAAETTDPRVAAAARELRARIEPAPIHRVLLGATLALLIVLTWWALDRT